MNDNIMTIFTSNNITDLSLLKTISYIAIFSYCFVIIINIITSIKIFNRGVNIQNIIRGNI